MSPFEYYRAVYAGKKFKEEVEFLRHYDMAKKFAIHYCGMLKMSEKTEAEMQDTLCCAAETIMPYMGGPCVTEEKFENYSVKIDWQGIAKKLYDLYAVSLPQCFMYRGVR